MSTLARTRRQARETALVEQIRTLPREVKLEIMQEIDTHAPELRDLMQRTGAVPMWFRVRDGLGWRDVISPAIVRSHHNEADPQ